MVCIASKVDSSISRICRNKNIEQKKIQDYAFRYFIYSFIYLLIYLFIYLSFYLLTLFNVDYKTLAAYALIKIDYPPLP